MTVSLKLKPILTEITRVSKESIFSDFNNPDIVTTWKRCSNRIEMKHNLFNIISPDFFKPLTSIYKEKFVECILLIYEMYKTETSYGIDKKNVVDELQAFFENDDSQLNFDDENIVLNDAREKANLFLNQLKKCGWIEEETQKNHIVNIQLVDNAIPIIESFERIIKNEETEYQGIVSQINAVLENVKKSSKPYEEILIGVQKNTQSLVSELKRLSSTIKRNIEKQTKQIEADEIIKQFFQYNASIVSNSYYRLKTNDNISQYRSRIIENLEKILTDEEIFNKTKSGFIKVKSADLNEKVSEDEASESIVQIVRETQSHFRNLDEIIEVIDEKNALYINNAVRRAKFLLSSGSNTEGKINAILKNINTLDVNSIFSIFSQNYISEESLRTIPMHKTLDEIKILKTESSISEETRKEYKEKLLSKKETVLSRKNVDDFVHKLLENKNRINVKEIEVQNLHDFIRIIYIVLYSNNPLCRYKIDRKEEIVEFALGYKLKSFDIIKREKK